MIPMSLKGLVGPIGPKVLMKNFDERVTRVDPWPLRFNP